MARGPVLVGPVNAVERAQQRGPLEQAVAAAGLLRVLFEMWIGRRFVVERDFRAGEHLGGELDNLGLRLVQRTLAGQGLHLDATRLLQPVDQVEGLWNARAADQQPVVAQHHRAMAAEVRDQALLLPAVEGGALVVVIGKVPVKAHRRLRERQQPFLQRRHRDAGRGVRVHHAVRVLPRFMDRAVDDVSRSVHRIAVIGFLDDVARQVDLDQARGGDLLVEHPVAADQDVVLGTRHARGDVVVDQVRHAVLRHQAIAGGKIDAHLPLGRAHPLAHRPHRLHWRSSIAATQ